MNILEKRYIPSTLTTITQNLMYDKHNELILAGSSGLASQLYPSDYDLITNILMENKEDAYTHFYKILDSIKQNDNLFFIELKFQNKKSKYKIDKIDNFTKETFLKYYSKELEYIKIDLVVYLTETKIFKELSIIYNFVNRNDKKIIEDLKMDYADLIHEKKFYKALKRMFSLISRNKVPEDKEIMLKKISVFFNSETGKEYQRLNNLLAIQLVFKKYGKDPLVNKKIKTNLKDVGFKSINSLHRYIKKLEDTINNEARIFLLNNKLREFN